MQNTKVFFSYSFTNREKHNHDYLVIKEFLEKHDYSCYCFVFDYTEPVSDNHLMMDKVFEKIDEAEIYIADPLFNSFGIGVESGYAKSRNKKIIYLNKIGSSQEDTLEGIADHTIRYTNTEDIIDWLSNNINKLTTK